jgi:hypothetical protein
VSDPVGEPVANPVTVTLTDGADVGAVVDQLQRAGLTVDQVLGAIGVVTGSVAQQDRATLAGLDGVLAVEDDHTFQLPPPDSDIQ